MLVLPQSRYLKISEPSREVTVDEMVNEILPYKPYFDASGGGVTVSGGEPLLQMPFLEKLFAELKEKWCAHLLRHIGWMC